jgi:hypothetical protein
MRGAVRVEEAQRNNAASRTPTAVLNVICKRREEEKKFRHGKIEMSRSSMLVSQ